MKVINKQSVKKSFSWVMIFSMFIQIFIGVQPVFADQLVAGKLPSSATSVTNPGATSLWSNASQISTDNNGFATVTITPRGVTGFNGPWWNLTPIYGSNKYTNYIMGSNYGFNLPDNAVIEGIKVKIDRGSLVDVSGLGIRDLSVNLVKDGSITGNNYANMSTAWPIVSSVRSYGTGSSDLWGTTWTAADINSSNFGVAFSIQNSALLISRMAYVDYISVDVYYSSAPVIESHLDVIEEATSAIGAIVNYSTPNSVDDVDGSLPADCTMPSGSQFPIGTTSVQCNKTDAAGNIAVQTKFNVTVQDTTAPATPTLVSPLMNATKNPGGLDFKWTSSDDISGPVTYEYKSSWVDGSYGPVNTGTNNFISVSGSADNTYNWQVRACDSLNNCSAWSGPWVVTLDSTSPTAHLDFNLGTGSLANGFQVHFNEQMDKDEVTDPSNYFLTNWPDTGGSGPLGDNATVSYDSETNIATITFTNPGWYVSPEQLWGVQNVHDIAGNVISTNPTEKYSTEMLLPVTINELDGVIGLNGDYVSDVKVTLPSSDGDIELDPYSGVGSETKTTYYNLDDSQFTVGTSLTVTEDGKHSVCYYSVDNAGNEEKQKCVSFTIDQTHPTISLNPYNLLPTNQNIEVMATTDEGTLNFDSHTFIANGSFEFIATDAAGNSTTKTVTITNIDKTAPIISLNGGASIGLIVGGLYDELGAIVDDASSVSINGIVNMAVAGTYTITYTSTDAAGNVAAPVTRTVIVSEAPVFFTAGEEVLGDTTTEKPPVEDNGEVKGTADKKDDSNRMQDAQLLGVAWYWWLVGGLAAAGIGWWFIAGFLRRNEDN